MRYLIGIDDTDNLDSRGTGYRARRLGELLSDAGVATLESVTRHQLLVDPRIPYTSHNSAACLTVSAPEDRMPDLAEKCREYLLRESAEGSDAGLCIASLAAVGTSVQQFGRSAKIKVVNRTDAQATADREGLLLEGLTGDKGGVIGALAAVGLRAFGTDGRFLWLRGLRELSGNYSVAALKEACTLDEVKTLDCRRVDTDAIIEVGAWPRPVLQGGKSVLLVEEDSQNEANGWRVVAKEIIKQY